MKFDLHVHTKYSEDGQGSPKDFILFAKKKGLDGFAITDHNSIGALKEIKGLKEEIIVIPGIEVSTSEGHILALGVWEEIPRGLSPEETLEKIHELGGIAVVAHPERIRSGLSYETIEKILTKIDAIEVFNARSSRRKNEKARKYAERKGIPGTGGSDAHSPEQIGFGITEIEGEFESYEEILEEIRKGNCKGFGKEMPTSFLISLGMKNVILWLKRGMKRI